MAYDDLGFDIYDPNGTSIEELLGRISKVQSQISTVVEGVDVITGIRISSEIFQSPETIRISAQKLDLVGAITIDTLSEDLSSKWDEFDENGQLVNQWRMPGTTTINGANIETGTIIAEKISTGTLSGVTINVDTDLSVGETIYLGEYLDVTTSRQLYFNNTAFIKSYRNATINSMEIYANETFLEGGTSTVGKIGVHSDTSISMVGAGLSASFDGAVNIFASGYDINLWTDTYISGALDVNGSITSYGETLVSEGSSPYFYGISVGSGWVTAGAIDTTASYMYVRGDSGVRCTAKGSTTSYVNCYALGYPGTSFASMKDNIRVYDEDAWGIVKNVDVFNYHFKSELEQGIYDRKKIGFLWETLPPELRHDEGVEAYTLVAVLWKAFKQATEKIEALEKEVQDVYTLLGVA